MDEPVRISGSTLYQYELCPAKPYCLWTEDPTDLIPLYLQKRMNDGQRYEKKVVSGISGIVEVKDKDKRDAYRATIQLMKRGVPWIYQGVIAKKNRIPLLGTPDLMRRIEGRSKLGGYHYEILDVKSSRELKNSQKMQVVFYAYLLEAVQGVFPEYSWIINGLGQYLKVNNRENLEIMLAKLKELQAIALGAKIPPIYQQGECERCQWQTHCLAILKESDCVSLLRGVGPKLAASLNAKGFKTLTNLYRARVEDLIIVDGVREKTANKLIISAKSMKEDAGKIHVNEKLLALEPEKESFILDFEGIYGKPKIEDTFVYLAGILRKPKRLGRLDAFFSKKISRKQNGKKNFYWRFLKRFNQLRNFLREQRSRPCIRVLRGNLVEVIQITGKNLEDEKKVWYKMIDFFSHYSDFAIYHYGVYDKTVLKRLISRYGKRNPSVADKILESCVDLYQIVLRTFTLPITRYKLKTVVPYLIKDWKWRSLLVQFDQWIESMDRKEQHNFLEYNRDDLYATQLLLEYLLEVRDFILEQGLGPEDKTELEKFIELKKNKRL